jgi:hypothetical protein
MLSLEAVDRSATGPDAVPWAEEASSLVSVDGVIMIKQRANQMVSREKTTANSTKQKGRRDMLLHLPRFF